MNRLTAYIEIHLLSETILGGEGEQKGTVDIDIQVDEHGLPYFAARTLKGVLRKEATWYIKCLTEDKRPAYERALFQLFGKADDGDEHHSNYEALRFGNATLSKSLYEVIEQENCSPRDAMKAMTTVRGMTSIDEEKGVAKDGSLRKARMIHSGYTFVAPIFANRTLSEIEKNLLSTSVKLLRHIGMMRNRGKGEVTCTIHWEERKEIQKVRTDNERGNFIYLTIDVEEPLKINHVLKTSDSTKALTYIPGHVLRGALVHTYLQDRNLNPDDLDTEHIFHPEQIQFWNGYLMIDEKRSIPFAQHLFETKAASKSQAKVRKIYNSLQDGGLTEIRAQSPVRISQHMMTLENKTISAANVDITSSLHINIYGPDGKRDDALLYRYEAICPNQRFQAVVKVAENHDFVRWLSEKESFYVWLGGARNSGYGRCRVIVETGNKNIEIPNDLAPYTDELYIIATSDWIIYNEHGQLVSALDEKWLSKQLNASLQLAGQVVHTELTGGYISNWRAYQPMIRSVKAGSVFRYKINAGTVDEEKLRALINRGVGSRTNEGFGRFIALPKWNYDEIKFIDEKTNLSTLTENRLLNKEQEKKEMNAFIRAIRSERIKETVFNEVNRWYNLTGVNNLKKINSSQWSKLLQVTTDISRTENDVSNVYKDKWETFWKDVKQRMKNKSKLGFDKIKIAVSEEKKSSLEDFILKDLCEKRWVPDKEQSIQWSLIALELFIRKILRAR